MSSEKNLHRIAFRITLYLIGFLIIPLLVFGFFTSKNPDSGLLLGLFVVSVLVAVYFAIKRVLVRVLPAEGLQIIGRDDVFVEPQNAVWSFTWGMYWRTTLVNMFTDPLASALTSGSHSGTSLSMLLSLVGWYFSAVWLFKYQYGELKVVSADQPVLIESNVETKLNGGGMTKVTDFFATIFGFLAMGLYILVPIGELYWLWMSFKIGSFLMFVLGLFPITMIPAAFVGAYGLIFGMPDWVYSWFS